MKARSQTAVPPHSPSRRRSVGFSSRHSIYVALNREAPFRQGWAIPTATDIAFALGVLTLLGKRVPPSLRVLLLALAIIDDIAAILVIALFYSGAIAPVGLLIAAAGIVGVVVFQKLGIGNALAYLIPGGIIWVGFLYAGVHPTLAGVILGLLTPVTAAAWREPPVAVAAEALDEFRKRTKRARGDRHALVAPVQQLKLAQRELLSPVVRIEAALHPWVAYAIMPLFALANAGVALAIPTQASGLPMSVPLGIALALILGKPLGICLTALLAAKSGIGRLPEGVTWRGVLLIGCLGGIGFTMSVFIANLAFADESFLASAKLAILIGSGASAIVGLIVGRLMLRPPTAAGAMG
jgi:NhaA family Na+:H+ antiporter